ncbi:MAG: HEAT repeat domain-containing protein [Planctomycetaceae bacterium]|nr:HEAT repeat domain-containing protein [Planctomycetales bacterium]MCB9872559.1 HEAT repeat domain-containing protein [Planctomycetaceae bacterium]MCB9939615.1 HEAT repeat domain-containing protein [Planctomycetaceae bacterium]HRX77496.1 HEAT repeat domain-containing protein [Pirellulaceae bacterium]
MSSPEKAPPKPSLDDKPLPPIEPPSAGFLLQLFVIPMIIVGIIVAVWLMFSWLAHMGSNPHELVRDLKKPNEASWQRALTLADLLRNPAHEDLKSDVTMATELATVLDGQLDQESYDETSIRLRMFLARALGEFKVPEALPPVLRAATLERDPAEIDVRRTALEAIAVYANNNPDSSLSENAACMEALIAASRERTEVAAEQQVRSDLRSTAAFVLGVIGGDAALDRLVILLDDPYTNARYNAATGLCRHGDARAIPVLLEMLDPENQESGAGEEHESGRDWKRLQVINTGIRSAAQLAENNSSDDLEPVRAALQEIVDSELNSFGSRVRHGIRLNAEDSLLAMKATSAEATAQ